MSSHPASPPANDRLLRAAPYALFALLVLAVYADPLFRRRNFAGRDLTGYNLPIEQAIHDAYSRGRLPTWLSEVSGGRPLIPNPNKGGLYPLRPVLALVPFPLAVKLFPVIHWAAAGFGMLLLLRALGLSAAGAWIGAVTYVFSGVSVSEVFFSQLPGLMLLPWILWAFQRKTASLTRFLIPLSLLLATDIIAGDPFTLGLALLACVLWVALEMGREERVRRLALLGVAFTLACLAAAPQIMATALWIPETNRSVLGLRLWEALYYTISPLRLLELFVPFPFGETWTLDPSRTWAPAAFRGRVLGIFATLYAGAFGVIALIQTRRRSVPGVRFARVFAIATLVGAILPSFLPRAWEALWSPVSLRNPEKLAIGSTFAFAILAGHALEEFRRRGRTRWLIGIGAAFAVVAAWVAWGPAGGNWWAFPVRAQVSNAAAQGGIFWMATAIALDRLKRSPPRLVLPLLLLTLVPIAANRRIARSFRTDEVFSKTPFVRYLDRVDPHGNYRILGESYFRAPSRLQAMHEGSDVGYLEFSRRNWEQYTQAFWKRGTVFNDDFDAGDLSRVQSLRRFARAAAGFADSAAFFGAVSLRYGVRFRDQPALAGYVRVGGDALQDWDEHRQALPDVRLLTRWRETPGPLQAVNEIPRLQSDEIVLETGRAGNGASPGGSLRILEKTPERVRLETETPLPGWLFVLRGYWPHRSVRVDGQKVGAVPAQVAFSAVAVPAGRHRIEWIEEVPGLRISRWGPVLYVLAVGWIAARSRSRRAR